MTAIYEVRPGHGIGPVNLDMTVEEAHAAMEDTGNNVIEHQFPDGSGMIAMHCNAFGAHFHANGVIEHLSLDGRSADAQEEGWPHEVGALLGGKDIFRTPPDELLAMLEAVGPLLLDEPGHPEFPTLGLSLYKTSIDEVKFFEGVIVVPPVDDTLRSVAMGPPTGGDRG